MNQPQIANTSQLNAVSKFYLYCKKIGAAVVAVTQGFYLVYRYQLYNFLHSEVDSKDELHHSLR